MLYFGALFLALYFWVAIFNLRRRFLSKELSTCVLGRYTGTAKAQHLWKWGWTYWLGHSKLATRFENSVVFCLGHSLTQGSQAGGQLGAADSRVLPMKSWTSLIEIHRQHHWAILFVTSLVSLLLLSHTVVLIPCLGVKLFNHRTYQRLRVKNFIGTASKNFSDYFSLDLCAFFFFTWKILPIATYFIFNPASDEENMRRCVLPSQSWSVQGRGIRCRSSQANYISLRLAVQRHSCTMEPLLVKKLHKKRTSS